MLQGEHMAASMRLPAAAKRLRVHPGTLRRWLLHGKITGIAKDRNGWWIFEPKDIRRILKWKNRRYIPKTGGSRA